jgi:hypothetical protein
MTDMRRHLAVLVLLVLGACSGDGARTLGPVPTTASTVPVTSTVPPATTTTAIPVTTVRASTTTTAGPRLVEGVPQVTATPARATVGQRVRLEGTGFTDAMWRAADAPLWLAGAFHGCDFFARANHSLTVTAAGRLAGELTVPEAGDCRMTGPGGLLLSGTYRIVFACTACTIGQVEVTGVTRSACPDIGFTPNSDNVASDIYATNMTCAEADTLVRKVGPQVGAVGGPSRLEVDGFVCVRTSSSQAGLPSSEFECTSGSKKVTFTRT